ncbi:MAG: family 43 glycosylhydrolase [Candidatus Coproplasma sp.]
MQEQLTYKNPVIFADYSDPDVIRVGGYFYLISSSFNFVPGIPVLRSENLVEWELVNYVVKRLPFERFNGRVCAGDGVWAPSLREHCGRFYCVIPFPDDGIYVSETDDIEGEWSPLRPLIVGKGFIDPCPIWDGDKCYLAVAFARSRIGFNSKIGLFEVSPDLTKCISDGYKIIYDGRNNNPVIEGPKFYKRNGYYYILAPAGTVKGGWQAALRSKDAYGPYESKIILMQGDTYVNGPHQGALVDTADGADYFLHFQDMRPYGRVVHLQPVVWQDGWCICGKPGYDGIAGTPVEGGIYPVQIKTCACLPSCDDFNGRLSPMWQTPANPVDGWGRTGDGLTLNCLRMDNRIEELPTALTTMVYGRQFVSCCNFTLFGKEDGDEAGFGIIGVRSAFVSVVYEGGEYLLRYTLSGEGGEEIVLQNALSGGGVNVAVKGVNCDIYRIQCTFSVHGEDLPHAFFASEGVWVGARFALFARNRKAQSEGKSVFTSFSRSVNG